LSGSISTSEYVFTTARGSTTPPFDYGVVAVIDGQTVKVTPFQVANIPPPMSLHEIFVPSNALDVSFNVDASLIAVLDQQGISVFEWKSISVSATAPVLTGRYTFEENDIASSAYQQIAFADKTDLVTLQHQGPQSVITRYGFNDETGRIEKREPVNSPSSMLCSISSFNDNGSILPFAQDLSGNLHQLVSNNPFLAHCGLPNALPWIDIVSHKGLSIAFGMSSTGNLYANSRLLIKNCTSFLLTSTHLIFTTTTHLIKFVHITDVEGMVYYQTN
jgi:elongator complex protein 1